MNPKFYNKDGTPTSHLTLSTTLRNQSFEGTSSESVVDVQIDMKDGRGFVSDPDLVHWDASKFQVPNPFVYPEGMTFAYGSNVFEIRTIDVTGTVSNLAKAEINVLRPDEVELPVSSPTGLRVRRHLGEVEIVWAENPEPNILGYHVYAATTGGGGTRGYFKVTESLISEASFQEDFIVPISENQVLFNNQRGQVRVTAMQEDFNEIPLVIESENVSDTSLGGETVRVNTTVESVETVTYYSFKHARGQGLNSDKFVDVPVENPLYYVVSAILLDEMTGIEVESSYSSELVGSPLNINQGSPQVPRRSRLDAARDYIDAILRSDNEISVIPGSVVKDIFINPFSSEVERLHFITDFIRRCASFSTLLVIDDSPSYKGALSLALGLGTEGNVQPIVDDAFDRLAGNSNVLRGAPRGSVGTVTFYTGVEPTQDLIIDAGTIVSDPESGTNFEVVTRTIIPHNNRDSFYSYQKRRWEVQASIRSRDSGSQTNVPALSIIRAIGTPLSVENLEATRFGRDEESNRDLASRAILAYSSVDAGTEGGYMATALKQVGVQGAQVIKAGDPLMMRDYDVLRNKNVGGKVDIWVQGKNPVRVSDTFALRFDIGRRTRFLLDSDPSDLIFRVVDDRITKETPITEMLGSTSLEQAQGFGFRNVSSGQDFDLLGYQVLSYNRIQLDSSLAQPAIGANDLVSGDFRFLGSNTYIFSRQPTTEVTGIQSLNRDFVMVEGTHYTWVKKEDPLLEGYSALASDYVDIQQLPALGNPIPINDERAVLVGEIQEPLDRLGVNPLTVRVFTLDRLHEYRGPLVENPDFFLITEEGERTLIVRNPSGDIGNGEEISIDYQHDENFEVSYVVNGLITGTQVAVDSHRHITADALVKESLVSKVDLEITIVLEPTANKAATDTLIRNAISQLINSKNVGDPLHQSDVIRVIENTEGVDYVITPITRMGNSDDNLILRELLPSSFDVLKESANYRILIARSPLLYPTTDGGGSVLRHRGVFQDHFKMNLVSSYQSLMSNDNAAMIIGDTGLIIDGYSDDLTLDPSLCRSVAERKELRLKLTKNRVLIRVSSDIETENHVYHVSYETKGDRASRSTIAVKNTTSLELGSLTLTYR